MHFNKTTFFLSEAAWRSLGAATELVPLGYAYSVFFSNTAAALGPSEPALFPWLLTDDWGRPVKSWLVFEASHDWFECNNFLSISSNLQRMKFKEFYRIGIDKIGIDKKSKSNSFFCFSLYTDKVGVFMKSLSVCVCVCPVQLGFVEPECGWTLLLGVQS